MKNVVYRALINFRGMSDAALETKASTIAVSMKGNAYFPTPVPSLTDVQNALDDFSDSLVTAQGGKRADIAVKNQNRAALIALLRQLAAYVNFIANGDRAILLTSGFDITSEGGVSAITKPENLQVVNGDNPGELIVSVDSVPAAKAYMFEYSTDSTLAETSWQKMPFTQSSFTFTGLDSGKKYFCRVAAVGTRGQMVYSDIISRIVL